MKSVIEMIQGQDDLDLKEKKILELAKKNRDLTVKVESLRNKAARAMQEVNRIQDAGSPAKDEATLMKEVTNLEEGQAQDEL